VINNQSNHRQDAWITAGLLALTLLSRIPFRSQILYHWDSVNFAYAMREFSVAKEQPHLPGYIVYVWLCRLVNLLLGDAQTTMVWISITASALAVAALFCLGRAMFNRQTGLVAALSLASSPLFWFYGEIALPHTLDTLLVIVSVWWLYETMQGDYRYLYPAIAIMAIAGGIRQQTMIFLAPLLLFALRRAGWKRFLSAGALGVVICLAWFIPLTALSDGVSNYMSVMGAYSRRFLSTTSIFMGAGWQGVRHNVRKLTMYTLYGWSMTLIPGVIYAAGAASRLWRHDWPRRWEKPIFLLLWIAPALIFYSIIHMGQQGLVFIFLPALLLLGAVGLTRLLAAKARWLIATTAVLVALNTGIFYLVPEYPLGPGTQRLLTQATLVNSDHYYQDRFKAIEEGFAPASTAILAANWHHVEYYLPAYKLLPVDVISQGESGAGQLSNRGSEEKRLNAQDLGLTPDADGLVKIIIFDDKLKPFNETPELTQVVELDHGDSMGMFVLSENQSLYLGQTFRVDELY